MFTQIPINQCYEELFYYYYFVFSTLNTVAQSHTPMLELGKTRNMQHFDLVIGDDLVSPLIVIDDTNFSRSITTIGTGTFYGIQNLKFYETDCGEKIIEGIGILELDHLIFQIGVLL